MKTLLTLLFMALMSFNLLGQNYDVYRVVAYSNDDDNGYYYNVLYVNLDIYSISNIIKVPIEQTIFQTI